MECAKNRPGPSGATSPYDTWTYPPEESAAMEGGGREHPATLRSVLSTVPGALHDAPPSIERAASSRALLSARGAHQAAQNARPERASWSDPGHAATEGLRPVASP